MIDTQFTYEESYVGNTYETTIGYFMIDKNFLEELRPGQYPEAEHGEISVEYPIDCPEASSAIVMVSPTKDGSDYDWTDIELPYEIIEVLINVIEMHVKEI